ncbi:MAG: O-antigen ligase family protein [bacterium]|nr:O-antigen ligase family protein [bacterium]
MIKFCNKLLEYCYYALFLLVPLAFTSSTSELFELNKMWLTFGLTILIAFSWTAKSIVNKELKIQRTPLDIPIILFLLSQIISTIFSLDFHVSVWGYYSRFNGGLLSILSYIFLYYAFVSNLNAFPKEKGADIVKRLLKISLFSGLIVALWGLPSHFGYDPTCLLFRGTLDVSCWTEAFQPKVRIFSTLGQPDWLAAYLAILIPIAIGFAINHKSQITNHKQIQNYNNRNAKRFENSNLFGIRNLKFVILFLFPVLFYLDLTYTDARSGFIAIWIALITFVIGYFWIIRKKLIPFSPLKILKKNSFIFLAILSFFLIFFFVGTSVYQLDNFTFAGITRHFAKQTTSPTKPAETKPNSEAPSADKISSGGTESTKIRFIVWEGAIEAWKHYPIFGSGVETFAFAYYKNRPVAHNLTSEWDYLYNKAHNEYLNFLTTTGIVGLGTYLFMIAAFLFLSLQALNHKSQITNHKQIQNYNNQNAKHFENSNLFGIWNLEFGILNLALLAGYLSILVTNFFGFSVVVVNIYLFMIPAFVFILNNSINNKKVFVIGGKPAVQNHQIKPSLPLSQMFFIFIIGFISLYLLFNLFKFWLADQAYALGYNFDRAGQYQQAYLKLHEAVSLRGDEPAFKDELAINDAILSVALSTQKEVVTAKNLEEEAVNTSFLITSEHPNNIVFQKTKVRVFYTLSQVKPAYLPKALDAIKRVNELAPTDAKVSYNLGLLYGQNGGAQKAVEVLEQTIKLKPDYREAYYALGLYYHELAVDKNSKVVKPEFQQKAVETMRFLVNNFNNDSQARQILKAWGD